MRFAYADPPYFGCCARYDHAHFGGGCWDEPETHRDLIERLCDEFPQGWALSLSSPSLRVLLPFCPGDIRVGAWVKPFAVFKPNVNPAYAWEPVIWRGGVRRDRTQDTARDWHSENITVKKGLCGAKPAKFGGFIEGLLGARSTDTIVDLFPGTAHLHGLATWERTSSRTSERTTEETEQ